MTRTWILLLVTACTAPEVATHEAAITGGDPESGYPAVFALAYQGEGACTGTCVTPKVGLTAQHCIAGDPASAFSALFGPTEAAPTQVIQVTAAAEEPTGGDIAVVAFAEACPAVIPYNKTALEGHVGAPVVMVGFGVTTENANDAGIKRSGTATLFSVTPSEVPGMTAGELATSNDPDGTCNGDSGGPTFVTIDGTEYMAGVTSRGSLMTPTMEWPCGQGRSIAVRADSYQSFIDGFIAQHDPGAVGDPPPGDDPPPPGDDPPPNGDPPPGGIDDGSLGTGCSSGTGSVNCLFALVFVGLVTLRRRSRTRS